LIEYADVKKKATQLVEVTERGFMPPRLPAHGVVQYAEERILTTEELGLLRQWADEGAIEGNPADLPPVPQWSEGWQLGAPTSSFVFRKPAFCSLQATMFTGTLCYRFLCPRGRRCACASRKAHGNFGLVFMEQGDLMRAEEHFHAALRLNPEDVVVRQGLETLRQAKDRNLR